MSFFISVVVYMPNCFSSGACLVTEQRYGWELGEVKPSSLLLDTSWCKLWSQCCYSTLSAKKFCLGWFVSAGLCMSLRVSAFMWPHVFVHCLLWLVIAGIEIEQSRPGGITDSISLGVKNKMHVKAFQRRNKSLWFAFCRHCYWRQNYF